MSDPSPRSLSLRVRAYLLLREGHAIPQVAAKLRLSRQAVHYHALALEHERALARVPGTKSPLLFRRGPRAEEYERLSLGQRQDRAGRSGPSKAIEGARVHGHGYSWELASGPEHEPPWTHSWFSGRGKRKLPNFRMTYSLGGKSYRFWEIRGPRHKTLMVQPEEVYEPDPERVVNMREIAFKDVAFVARAFAKEFGYTFSGELRRVQPIEFGLALKGKPARLNEPSGSLFHVDYSPGKGKAEWESTSPDLTRAMMKLEAGSLEDLQERVARLEATTEGVAGDVQTVKGLLQRVVKVLEANAGSARGQADVNNLLTAAIVALAEAEKARSSPSTGQAPSGPEPGDPGPMFG